MIVFWVVLGTVLAALLLVSWRMDRAARRRGSRSLHHSDVWHEVRESRRDAEVVNPFAGEGDYSWSSWSRRDRR